MHSQLPAVDLAVFLVYMIGVVAFGCYFVVKSRSTEAFTAADRSLPGWALGISIFGTFLSSISFLAQPGDAYKGNWNGLVFALSLPLAAWIAVRFFVPYYRASREISAYSHLEKRFGAWARIYASLSYMLMQVIRVGIIMYLLALPLEQLLGWDIVGIIVVTGFLVTLYTLMGGIEAVVWTDVVQSIVLIVGAAACLGVLLFGMPDGPLQILEIGSANEKFSLGSFTPDLSSRTFWVVLAYGLFANLRNFGIDQNYTQRYATAVSDRAAGRSVWLGALLYIPISAAFFFTGAALFAFYKARPASLPQDLSPDRVFPHFIVAELPVGFTGLLIAAIFAAAMSTISSSLNSSATLVLRDFYSRYFRKDAGERESMRVLYGATFVLGVLGTLMGLFMIGATEKGVLDTWWGFESILGGGMLGLFLLGMLARKVERFASVTAVVIGSFVILWIGLSEHMTGDLEPFRIGLYKYMAVVIGTLTIFLVGVALNALVNRKATPAAEPAE